MQPTIIEQEITAQQAAALFAMIQSSTQTHVVIIFANVITDNGREQLKVYHNHMVGWCIQTYEGAQ